MEREKVILAGVGIAGAAGLGYLLYKYLKPIPPEDIVLADLIISPTTAYIGDTINIKVTATNIGEVSGSETVTMEVFGMEQSKTVILEPGESKVVQFNVTATQLGIHSVNVDGLTGNFTVTEQPGAQFIVSDLTISPTEVYPSEVVNISVVVTNVGEVAGSYTVVLEVS